MKKLKVYDASLINLVRRNTNSYDRYVAPKADIDAYANSMRNPEAFDTPDNFGASDLFKNAYLDWSVSKNSVDRDTELGDYLMADDDYNTLLGVKEYINADRAYKEAIKQLLLNPNDQDLITKITLLELTKNNNTSAYNKALQGKLNTTPVADYMKYALENGKYDSALSEIDRETTLQLKPGLKEIESHSLDNNIYNRRIVALQNAKMYNDRAEEFESKMTSDYYNNKKSKPGMDLTDIDTYLYKLPGLLGSSASSMGSQIIGTVSAALASHGYGGPLGSAGLALISIAANMYARDRESKAEVYLNYKSAVLNATKKAGIDKSIIKLAKLQMLKSGLFTNELINNDEFVYDQILSSNVKVDNEKFNKLRLSNLDGIKSLYMDNMALSGSDIVQQAIEVTPIGPMAKSIKGLKSLSKVLNSSAVKKAEKGIENLQGIRRQLALKIDDVTAFGLDNVSKLPKLTKRKAVLDLGGRILISSALEGAEEGVQYIKGQRYIDRDFDADPNLAKSFVKNLGTGARSIFAAVTPWDSVYSDDLEFLENFKGGALLGGLMTGAIGSATTYSQVKRLLPADKFVASLYAEKLDAKDRVRKNIGYGKLIRLNRWDNVMSSFDTLEGSNIEGITAEDVAAERKRAELLRNNFTSQTVQRDAIKFGIDPRTEDYDTYVALRDHHEQLLADAILNKKLYTNDIDALMYSKEVEDYLLDILKIKPEHLFLAKRIIVDSARKSMIKNLQDTYKQTGAKLNELEAHTLLRTSKTDVIKFKDLLDDLNTYSTEDNAENINELYKLGETPLEVPSIHSTLKDLVEKETYAALDRARAEAEMKEMSDSDGVWNKINTWKEAENKEEEFVQQLNDMYSGKTQEKQIEEGKEVAPEESGFTEPPTLTLTVEEPEPAKEPVKLELNKPAIDAATPTPPTAPEVQQPKANTKTQLLLDETGEKYSSYKTYSDNTHKIDPGFINDSLLPKDIFDKIHELIDSDKSFYVKRLIFTEDGIKAIVTSDGDSFLVDLRVDPRTNKPIVTLKKETKVEEQLTQESKDEIEANNALTKIKEKEKEVTTKIDDTVAEQPEATPVTPSVLPEVEEVPKVEELPTLGELLGGLVGEEAISQIDQADPVLTPEPEPTPQELKDVQQDLTYDLLLDPYSHELNYRLTSSLKDDTGKWIRTPKKYQGMEQYLNNDEFAEVTGEPDFVSETMRNGIRFEVKPFKDAKGNESQAIYAIFNYKGKEYIAAVKTVDGGLRARANIGFNRLPYAQQQYIENNLNLLRNKILELNKQVQANPNLQIVPTAIRTTTGVMVNEKLADGSPKNKSLLDSKWLEVKDPYKINPSNTEVGISTGPLGNSVIRLLNRVLSAKKGLPMGKPIWVIKAKKYDGSIEEKLAVLNYKYFKDSPKVADLILNLLLDDKLFYTDANGVSTNINPIKLLSFLVNFGSHTAVNPLDPKLNEDQIKNKMNKQFFIDEDDSIVIGQTKYTKSDLLTNKDIRELAKQYIMDNFHYNIDEDGLNKNYLGGDLLSQNRDPHFESVSSFLKNSDADKLIIIPGELEFSLKDFGISKTKKGKVLSKTNPNGISVLGWYIKQGILMTDLSDKLQDANIYVDDVRLVDKNDAPAQQEAQQKVQEFTEDRIRNAVFTLPGEGGQQQTVNMVDIYKILDGKDRTGANLEVKGKVQESIDTESATKWLQDKLGITPEITSSVIDITEAGANIVGKTTEDSIILSELAPIGTEYHEAWHRVSQLCIKDSQRKKIYSRYNKKNKANLTEAQLDEVFAEQFREFMLDESGKYEFDTKNWFRRILDFIKLWTRTGQYGLAKIYTAINRGKYNGIKPNELNVARFKQIYGEVGANLEVNGYQFKAILTYQQFDDIVKSLAYAFFLTSFTTGKTINYSDLAKEKPRFDTLKLIVQAQLTKFPSAVMDEVVSRFDDVFAPTIASRLKSLGIRAIEKNEQDITDIEEGSENVNIGQHTVEGMNISIKDNAPADVKFFFQTIPLFEGTANSANAKIDMYTHFPRFVDSKKAWDNILKDLAGCRTISNMLDKIVMMALNHDPFYQALLMKFTNLIALSNSKDPKVATNAEALLTKIETVITSDINNYVTAKISEDETGMTSMKLVDNTVDTKAIAYPKVWSLSMFVNSDIFKYNEQGVVVATGSAKTKLKSIIDTLTAARTAFLNNKGIYRNGQTSMDLHQLENQERLKDIIVQSLLNVGILIDKPTINRMLMSGDYGSPKADTYQLLNSFVVNTVNFGGLSKITSTLDTINSAIKKDGTVDKIMLNEKQVLPNQVWNEVGFVKLLAHYYAYTHATDKGLSSYGPDGNTYYMVSLNNFVKDRVNEMLTDQKVIDDLNSVEYNQNSILLNAINVGNRNISVETLINFKDNTSYDAGRDYFGITEREDYLAKMTAVFEDRIIFPTVADKKTYHFIKGISLPHEIIRFSKTNTGLSIKYGEEALDILLGYCLDELNQIELCLRQIDDNPNHYVGGVHYNEDGTVNQDWLEPSRRIKNFHTPNKYKYKDKNGKSHTVTLEGNGARFLFLTGIYTNEGFVNFNDPKKTAIENLLTAKDYFFNTSRETLMAFLSTVLNRRMKEELQTAKQLGLIEMDGNNIWSIRNLLLDDNVVAQRTGRYASIDAENAEGYAIFDMLSDYMINSIISVNEVEKIFSGAPAYYKVKYDRNGILDLSVDKIKRLGSLTSTGTNNRLDFYNDPLREDYTVAELKDHEIQDKQYYTYEGLFTRGNIKETILEIEGEEAWDSVKDLSINEIEKIYPESVEIARQAAKVEVAGYKEGINVADAAVYISPTMTRDLLRMRGEWSPEVKEAFEILTNPETADKWESDPELYAKANKVVLNAMKYMAFGTRFNEIPGLGIPYFNKMALFPLFKSVATGDIKALYDRMNDSENPIDMVLFDSAVKAGSRAPMKAYREAKDSEIELRDGLTVLSASLTDQLESGEGTILNDFNNLVTYTLKFKYLRQLLATDPHTHEDTMAGTQFMKVNLSNLRMNDMYGKEGEQVSGEQIKQTVMSALNLLSDIGKENIRKLLYTENGDVNITALGEMLSKDARESDANDNVISGLATKDDAFVIPLSALSDNKWIESRFISMINKSVIDVHMPGGAFILRSAFGLEATSLNVITPGMINSGKALKMINDEGSMDAVVSINLFKHFIPNYDKLTFTKAREWLIKHNIIGDNATANSIGYRIPTQSIASISPLRFVDVFPQIMGDTIMLPEGFTKLTGSDFDIDKLYVARFGFDENGAKLTLGDGGLKNSIIDAYLKVLLTKDNTNSLKLSIDNATENVKNVLKDIESNRKNQYAEPFQVYTPTYQEARKAEYTGGKAGIGPFALNNAHHILTLLTGILMVDNDFTRALKIKDLGRIYDYPTAGKLKGGRILDWLSAMINGFVDIAKDPYIVRLNVNSWTYNMVSFLLRTGKGAQTFYFVGQPILKEIAEEVIKTKGKYGIDRTKTPTLLEKEAIEKVLDRYDEGGVIRKKYQYINSKPELAVNEYKNLFSTFISNDTGEESSHNRELLLHLEDYNTNEELIRIYYAWLALKPYADSLANLVKYSKIDTKKTGKTFAEQLTYYNGMWDLTRDENFGEGEVDKFYKETFIANKTENSIPFGTRIFNNLLFRNTSTFLDLKDTVLSLLGRKNNADSKLLNAVISGMEALIKSLFFNDYAKANSIDIMSMFKGDRTIAKRLNKFKMEILSGNPNYSHLLNSDGTIANDFLNYLMPNIDNDNLDFVDTSELLSADQAEANNLINYWRELLDDSKPEIKRLARDLAVYAFITSGDNPTMNSFFQYLPNSFRKEIGYVDYVSGKLELMANDSSVAYLSKNDLFLNNWTNDKLVKPVERYHGELNDTFFSISLNDKSVVPNIILGQRTMSSKPSINPLNWLKIIDLNGDKHSYPIFPPFIKMNDKMGYNSSNWHVYTLIGYKEEMETNNAGKPTGRTLYAPIYGLVSKKGFKGKSGGSSHTIVEYGVETKFDFNKENVWDYNEALSNPEALADMASNYEKDRWNSFALDIHPITDLPTYLNMNYAKLELDRIYTEEFDDVEPDENDNGYALPEVEQPTTTEPAMKTYTGVITGLKSNQIFVFGSNTQGRHGKGAALMAKNRFGAVYGQSEGRQGQSYAIITKDLTKSVHPSRTTEQIIELIDKLYDYAEHNPNLEFFVAYSGTGTNLNAYSNEQMAAMFSHREIPSNIVFEENFSRLLNTGDLILTETELAGLYDLGDKRVLEVLNELEDLTAEERQTYRNEFAKLMTEDKVNTLDKLEEALRKFICNL